MAFTVAERARRADLLAAGLKFCPKCGDVKAVGEFERAARNRPSELSVYCKGCHNADRRADPEKRNARERANYAANPEKYRPGNAARMRTWRAAHPGVEAGNRAADPEKYHARDRWYNMLQRCLNPKAVEWKNYGSRGIAVWPGWQGPGGRIAFLTYVDALPHAGEPGYSLDRYPNNDGNYEPGNVRWATAAEQIANRRCRRRRPAAA